jgi:hypothetical protein
MKIISIHSHKGGCGKTTLALVLAKAHAMAGKKVCLLDLDFLGAGVDYAIRFAPGRKFLDEYVTRDPTSPDLPTVDELMGTYRDGDLGEKSFGILARRAVTVPGLGEEAQMDERAKQLAAMRFILRGSLKILLDQLEAHEYGMAILDCGPGIAYGSQAVLELLRDKFPQGSTSLFMATPDRPHIFGLLEQLNFLSVREGGKMYEPGRAVLVINRGAGAYLTYEQLFQELAKDPLDLPNTGALLGLVVVKNYCRILERPEFQLYSVGSAGEIPLPPHGAMEHSQTPLCRDLFSLVGERAHAR